MKQKNIAYLLGAGATHAEKQLELKLIGSRSNDPEKLMKNSLLAPDISKEVFELILTKQHELASTYGITDAKFYDVLDTRHKMYEDFELFIFLVESIKTAKSDQDALKFRRYFEQAILRRLKVKGKSIISRLYSALLEYNSRSKEGVVLGYLTLNYESKFEEAFKLVRQNFDYGLNVTSDTSIDLRHSDGKGPLLLKLHGSFNWYLDTNYNRIVASAKKNDENKQWIPPGLHKDYLNYPYNLIHGRAYEMLAQCDILRVIGCSLNKNDIGLISLIFKTQIFRTKPYIIDVVDKEESLKYLKKKLGGLLSFDESFYRKDEWTRLEKDPTSNPFLDWLYYKSQYAQSGALSKTKYLKDVKSWVTL